MLCAIPQPFFLLFIFEIGPTKLLELTLNSLYDPGRSLICDDLAFVQELELQT